MSVTPLTAARWYLRNRGWAPIPVPDRSKAPTIIGWQDLRLTEADLPRHFGEAPGNVGIVLGAPSGGLADIDLDCREARTLADVFLPETHAVFGRFSAPRSHRLYVAEGAVATERFRDPAAAGERATLVELRGTGAQTIFPPSVHPTGEEVAWCGRNEPARVAAAELRNAVARLAAASLLARHWPGEGARQDAALALAGGLLRGGWDADEVERFVAAVAEAAGDEESRSRAATARSTVRAEETGRPTTGWPRLSSLVGDKVVDAVREWLGLRSSGPGNRTSRARSASPTSGGAAGGATQATTLLDLAAGAGIECFRDAQGDPFASFVVDDHRETWPLRSKAVRQWLARLFFVDQGKAPGSQALQDALQVLDGEARFAGPELPVAVRLAEHEGRIYLDLGDPQWRVVGITPDGWSIVPAEVCPVRFRRPRGLKALPEPRRGGSVEALRPLMNLADEDDFLLVAGWLVGCLYPSGPRAVLQLLGEQGSAKSSQARLLRAMVDPNVVPLRAQPREEGDLLIAATNGALVALDNLSSIPGWLSDALCRLATGGGLSKRELYTDADEVLLDARRPVVLTAISEVATASDLLDRTLTVTLPSIRAEDRRTESEIDAAITAAQPIVLGGLLDAVAAGLANLPGVRLPRRPRLADFATFVEAAAPALRWEPGAFLDAMDATRRESDSVAIESLPVGPTVLAFMDDRDEWQGTATALLTELDKLVTEDVRKDREWPKRANRLSAQLRRLGPNLRAVGVWVGGNRKSGGQRLVILTKNREAWDRHRRQECRAGADGDGRGDDGGSCGSSSESSTPPRDRHGHRPADAWCGDGDDGDDAGAAPFQASMSASETGACDDKDYEEFEL